MILLSLSYTTKLMYLKLAEETVDSNSLETISSEYSDLNVDFYENGIYGVECSWLKDLFTKLLGIPEVFLYGRIFF